MNLYVTDAQNAVVMYVSLHPLSFFSSQVMLSVEEQETGHVEVGQPKSLKK